jgi:nucleotide-binding universal stress UspA family protein
MSPPILVGVDPLRHDPEAPLLAALLARATGAPVVAVAAYDDDQLVWNRAQELRGSALARLAAVEAAFQGVPLETAALAGPSPAQVLRDCAAERGAALLVVGSTHRGLSGRVTLGHTADRLLHGAPCPIAVAPLGFAERMQGIDRVGAAFVDRYDGHDALGVAVALAAACDAAVRATTAVEPLPWSATSFVGPYDPDAQVEHLCELARTQLRAGLDSLAPAMPAELEVIVDRTVTALEQLSAEVDLLVCGSRGHGPLGSVLLGGVSRRLIHRAACPVIVVPPGTRRALEALTGRPAAVEARHA